MDLVDELGFTPVDALGLALPEPQKPAAI